MSPACRPCLTTRPAPRHLPCAAARRACAALTGGQAFGGGA